jgi:ketosteroid isomerase-like protein
MPKVFAVEPHVRGDVAWAALRYELTVDEAQGRTEIEGRGTAVLERRGNRWQIVQLHTSGRRKQPGH